VAEAQPEGDAMKRYALINTARVAVLCAALGIATSSCSSTPTGPYNPPTEAARDTTKAERLNRDAADVLVGDPASAERLLRDALTADIFFGPAHNNLGVVFLGEHKLYEAASEFEWAKKLLPDSPDPRVNLALCLEQAGRLDDAIAAYETALQVRPSYLPAVQGIACLMLRSGKSDERVAPWLEDIAMRCNDEVWREWAKTRLAQRR
jgi:Tfp pilus assembly protein PilF